MFAPKKILVPTDFSPYSDLAMKEAFDVASEYKAKVVLLHVIDEEPGEIDEEDMRLSIEKLEKSIFDETRMERNDISYEIKKGIPAEVIVDEQLSNGIDLIVMASHSRSTIIQNIIGGTTDKVIRSIRCPVLVVRM